MSKRNKDLLLVKGPTEDGAGMHVIRARPERLELGTMRPLQEGRPIDGEVVRVNPHPECPYVYEVETEFSTEKTEAAGEKPSKASPQAPAAKEREAGPPKVASVAYRRNWDAIWNRQSKRRQALN